MSRVCVFMPCFNEAPVLKETIGDIKNVFSKSKYDFDVVVVNDRSTDDSIKVAESSGVIVVNHIMNTGPGGATATGMEYAKINDYDYAISVDSDGQHQAKDALACLEESIKTGTDLMIGSRLINTEGMSIVKIIGNLGLSIITWFLFGVKVRDSQSGMRVFNRKAINSLYWKSFGYEFCSEMLWRAEQSGLKVREYPIKAVYTEYSKSRGQNNWNGVNIVRALVAQKIVELFE